MHLNRLKLSLDLFKLKTNYLKFNKSIHLNSKNPKSINNQVLANSKLFLSQKRSVSFTSLFFQNEKKKDLQVVDQTKGSSNNNNDKNEEFEPPKIKKNPASIKKLLRLKDFVDYIFLGMILTGVYIGYQKYKANKKDEETHKVEWLKIPGLKHKVFTCNGFNLPEFLLKNLTNIKSFEPRKNDVWIVSFPKSGTTWVQELVYLITNDSNFEKAKTGSIEDRCPFIDFPSPGIKFINNMPTNTPRIIKTHLPLSFLPNNIENESKVIYIVRNPKDVSVSYYHFAKLSTQAEYNQTFSDFLKLFMEGTVPYGPWWKHVDEYANKKNILVIHYEDLHEKPYETVKLLGEFLNKNLNEKEINELLKWCSFDNMKKNPNVNYEHYKEIGLFRKDGDFFRKGKIGDWLNYFSKTNSQEFDDLINKNLNFKCQFNYGISKEDLQKIYSINLNKSNV